jgi:hypothetical protein
MNDEQLEAAADWLFRDRLDKLAQGRIQARPAPSNYLRSGLLTKGFPPSLVEEIVQQQTAAEPTVAWEVAELVRTIRVHLSTGTLTPTMVQLLDAHLGKLGDSEQWALLGLNGAHRRKSKVNQCDDALDAYVEAVKMGRNEDDALIAAYDAYFAASPKNPRGPRPTYAADSLKRSTGFRSLAAKRMKTIRQCLTEVGVLEPGKRGRPRK